MSAIGSASPGQGDLGIGDIRRYKTRCKILVHSHNSAAPLEIYDGVYAVEIGKSLKGVGTATCSLTPIENWTNLIFPNDLINIYFDIGDEQGWVRTFFGYIDRVEENYVVEASGQPQTFYRLVCSDFGKVFDRTQIYFNPHIAGRPDLIDFDFAENNIGGLALASRGIKMGGPPGMMVVDLILLLTGFGAQYRLPECYPGTNSKDRLRTRRVEKLAGSLPAEFQSLGGAATISTYKRWQTDAVAKARSDLNNYYQQREQGSSDGSDAVASYDIDPTQLEGKSFEEQRKILTDLALLSKVESQLTDIGAVATQRAAARRSKAILDSSVSELVSFIDVVDPFTFVEFRAMDGFQIGKSIWQKQGSLTSTLRTISNESVNELFFDLRALNYDKNTKTIHTDPISGKFGRAKDDAEGNIGGSGAEVGVYYTPAVVMREYPFSTIQGLNLSNLKLDLRGEDNRENTVGYLQFGEIFSNGVNEAGRHVITVNNINIPELDSGGAPSSDRPATKHLDVAVINSKEIIKSQLGRSDADHYNIFEYFSDSLLGTAQKYYMKDFLPVISHIHIIRGGLRRRTVSTKAARFNISAVQSFVRQGGPTLTILSGQGDGTELARSESVV